MHTKEPWTTGGIGLPGTQYQEQYFSGPRAEPHHQSGPSVGITKGPNAIADGHRLCACVNALAGIADPAGLRAALEEVRSARLKWNETWRYGPLLAATDKLLNLLPPETAS